MNPSTEFKQSHRPAPLAVPEMDGIRTPAQRKSMLPALTGMRAIAALNIVFFHFSDPKWFGPFAPVVRNGYVSVSFFLLLSGFVLAYNYRERADAGKMEAHRFWVARFSRIYPVYVFSLVLSLGMLMDEYHAQTRGHFYLGLALTPLLLQGWSPLLCTFWNTPAWTLTTDVLFYAIFPVLITWQALTKRLTQLRSILLLLFGFWMLGLVLPTVYSVLHPDGDPHIDRYSGGFWLRALKFGPVQHVPSFLFGMALAALNNFLPERSRKRVVLGLLGFASVYAILYFGDRMPYIPKEQLAAAMDADPVPKFRAHLAEAGICTQAELDGIDNEALATVEAALQTVMAAESPAADELDRDVYATPIKFPV